MLILLASRGFLPLQTKGVSVGVDKIKCQTTGSMRMWRESPRTKLFDLLSPTRTGMVGLQSVEFRTTWFDSFHFLP